MSLVTAGGVNLTTFKRPFQRKLFGDSMTIFTLPDKTARTAVATQTANSPCYVFLKEFGFERQILHNP